MEDLPVPPFDPDAYGPACAILLGIDRLCDLGPGDPDDDVRSALDALDQQLLFEGRSVVDPSMADCCLSGLWLLYDQLDQSHGISQQIDTTTGSYWHGIMHRREPDFSNSKYWFRRVGQHAVFEPLAGAARELVSGSDDSQDAVRLAEQTSWDPYAFIDLCEAVAVGRASCELLCRRIAQAEWELLFDYCYRKAIGG
jgi:hypothetical protein